MHCNARAHPEECGDCFLIKQKNDINFYDYNGSICIDIDHGFIRRYALTSANIHDSQTLPRLLDPGNEHDDVWAGSAYSGERSEGLMKLGGFESLIHEKALRIHPLGEAAKKR